MSNRLTNFLAVVLLVLMFVLAVASMAGDSLTMDELAHLPAGYSYLTQRDMRLNPEHPPLMKDLAGLPLLFIKNINFPSDTKYWQEDVNGQWDFGNKFLFKSENPVDTMIFWGRIPMILILTVLGFYVFRWTRELFGNTAALLALFLFAFSPTLLAHGRLVTTDVAAATGAFIATYYFLKFLKDKSSKNIIKAGIAFGLAELFKFSLILLVPFFLVLVLAWLVVNNATFKTCFKNCWRYLWLLLLIFVTGSMLIWLVYIFHTWGYPGLKQASDTRNIMASLKYPWLTDILVWMADKPVLKGLAQYLLGLVMVLQRASGGNTGYFLGEISNAGWKTYFPTVYAIKETLTFHIFSLFALLYCAWLIKKPFWIKPWQRITAWIRTHFAEFSMLTFIAIYWLTSLTSNLNIGVRHLLPVFPFTMLLVAGAISIWARGGLYSKLKAVLIGFLLAWQVVSVVSVYPHFLSYFNELVGGSKNGYLYVTDSNLDWGQDLKRLTAWVDTQKIDKIYVDYFGGADVKYYLKEKYAPWWGQRSPNEMPKGSYFAISATLLQGGQGEPAKGFDQPIGYYRWLARYAPVARIGYSIFVFRVD